MLRASRLPPAVSIVLLRIVGGGTDSLGGFHRSDYTSTSAVVWCDDHPRVRLPNEGVGGRCDDHAMTTDTKRRQLKRIAERISTCRQCPGMNVPGW